MRMHMMNRRNEPLTIDQIANLAPAALATQAHESRSDKYAYIPTIEVIRGMEKAGFLPFAAKQSGSRDEARREFTKHMIRFRHASYTGSMVKVGDVFPEIVLVNAHDGSSAYKLMSGLFRLACSNGMVVSQGEIDSLSIPHKGNVIEGVIEGSTRILSEAPKTLDTVQRWSQLQLTSGEQQVLAEAAHTVRFADREGNVETPITAAQLLTSRRYEDHGNDLWKTFNRIQENVIRGGIRATGRDANGRRRRVSSREVSGIGQDVNLNKALWTLAEKMDELKKRA